jgi:hypothetical protein
MIWKRLRGGNCNCCAGYPLLIVRVSATMSFPGVGLSANHGGGQTLFAVLTQQYEQIAVSAAGAENPEPKAVAR